VFGLQLAGVHKPAALQELLAFGQKLWKASLPAIEQFQLGAPIQAPAALARLRPGVALQVTNGVSFQSFKPDGTLAWRLLVQENLIAINCLDYNGWENVWPRAREYLSQASNILVSDKNAISGATLQYINSFNWEGALEKVDAQSIFRRDAPPVPAGFWDRRSPEWHLHQGWFEEMGKPIVGRILHREQLAGRYEQVRGQRVSVVLVDLLNRYDFKVRDSSGQVFFDQHAEPAFHHMRVLLRRALRTYLTDVMLEEIGARSLE
jgi:uncharacterized protein (TIGR04255 family)